MKKLQNRHRLTPALILLAAVLILAACDSGMREIETEPVVDTSPDNTTGDSIAVRPGYEYTPSSDRAHDIFKPTAFNNILQYDDGFIYAIVTDGIPYRFNPETGYMTAVCPDPLCDHIAPTACGIIDHMSSMDFHNGICYYDDHRIQKVTNPATGQSESVLYRYASSYDMKSAKFTEYCEQCYFLKDSFYYGDYRYYTQYLDPDDPENSPFGLFRIHLPTDTHELIKEFELGEVVGVWYADDTYLYYCIGLDNYRIPLDAPDKAEKLFRGGWYTGDLRDDDYIYANATSKNGECIIRISWEDFTIETLVDGWLFDDLKVIRCTDDYIYYRSGEAIERPEYYKPMPIGDFYRLPKAGGEPELVFELTDEFIAKYIPYYFIVDGNYIYCICFKYDEEGQQYVPLFDSRGSENGPELLRINILTKEYDIITPYNQ